MPGNFSMFPAILLLGFATSVAAQEAIATPGPIGGLVLLEYSQTFGRSLLFRDCTTTVTLHEPPAPSTVSARCARVAPEARSVEGLEDISPEVALRIRDLVRESRLFEPPHTGTDSREVDGTFSTLTVVQSPAAAVLVVSGNESFSKAGPRHDLVEWLKKQRQSLVER